MITIKDILADHNPNHTEFQLDYFVTIKAGGVTPYAQYKQAVRELAGRTQRLILGNFDIREEQLDVADAEEDFLSRADDDKDRERARIVLERKRFSLTNLINDMAHMAREWYRFYEVARRLKEVVGELTPERVREYEYEAWRVHAMGLVAIDVVSSGHLRPGTVDHLQCLPDRIKGELFPRVFVEGKDGVASRNALVDEFMRDSRRNTVDFDAIPMPGMAEIKQAIMRELPDVGGLLRMLE